MSFYNECKTGLKEAKNVELKSIYEKILYSKVYGSIDRQYKKFGYSSIEKRIDEDGFYKEVFTSDYYKRAREGMYDCVIRRVVNKAQYDYLSGDKNTYECLSVEFADMHKNKQKFQRAEEVKKSTLRLEELDADNELKDINIYGH